MTAKKKSIKKVALKQKVLKQMPLEQPAETKAVKTTKPAENSRLKRKIIISACVAVGLFIFASIFLNLIVQNAPIERSLPVKEYAKAAVGISCTDKCGDNECGTMVCMAEGCTCSENYRTCPNDCHEARFEDLAEFAKDSECIEKGELTENYAFNPETRTWWINMKMKPEFEKEGCSPACVIYEDEDKIELNWRCTGVVVP